VLEGGPTDAWPLQLHFHRAWSYFTLWYFCKKRASGWYSTTLRLHYHGVSPMVPNITYYLAALLVSFFCFWDWHKGRAQAKKESFRVQIYIYIHKILVIILPVLKRNDKIFLICSPLNWCNFVYKDLNYHLNAFLGSIIYILS
jgi:hypothetical protein